MRVGEREIYMHGCTVRNGADPTGRDESGYLFDIDDIRPSSHRGEQWIREMYHTRDRGNRRLERLYNQEDSAKYSMGMDWGHEDRSVKMSLRRATEMSKTIMNEKEILATALLDNFTTALCATHEGAQKYTFKKPLDMELEEGDKVVVSLNDGHLKMSEVCEVHDCVVNPEDIKLAWIVQRVDTTQYDQLLEMDKMAVSKIRDMEKRKAKRELLAEFSTGLSDSEQKQLGSDLGINLESK